MYAVYVKNEGTFVSAVYFDRISFSSDEEQAIKFSSAEHAACFIDCLVDRFSATFGLSIYKF